MRRIFHNFRPAAGALGLALLVLSGAPAPAEDAPAVRVWQWTDRAGVTRYTPDRGRIPGYARDSAVEMRPGEGPPPTTPVYFEPDPRAPVAALPGEAATAVRGSAVPAPARGAVAEPADDLDGRIRQLEAQIADDEEALKQLISAPGTASDVEVSQELREIAARLPQLQAQLASLQKRRGGSGSP